MTLVREIVEAVEEAMGAESEWVRLALRLVMPDGQTRGTGFNVRPPGGAAGPVAEVIEVGDRFELEVRSPVEGYLTVFNLGTSGKVQRVVPTRDDAPPCRLATRGPCRIPGAEFPGFGPWRERGPTTAAHGLPERVLAVLLRDAPRVLRPADLHADLDPTGASAAGGAISELYARGLERVRFGLLSLPVVDAAGGEARP